jgi:hypothetical protein
LSVAQREIYRRDLHFPTTSSSHNEESYLDDEPNWKKSRSGLQTSWQTSFAGATINGNIYFGVASEEKKRRLICLKSFLLICLFHRDNIC